MKIVSCNVNGMRSVLGKGFLDFLRSEAPDVVCIQETKARREQVEEEFEGWHVLWNAARKPGYSGTAILARQQPLSATMGFGDPTHDDEGRVINAEFPDFHLVNVYTPNSQRELTRLDYRTREWTPAFIAHLQHLKKSKPVVFCGDMNVAHREIDLARPKSNTRNAGFTTEEREAFDAILDAGFTDTFRLFEQSGGHYTWWSYQNQARQRNIGWRIDYFCVTHDFVPAVAHSSIRPEITGSDHCPTVLSLDI
jgi:exodeoxyribonuclease III